MKASGTEGSGRFSVSKKWLRPLFRLEVLHFLLSSHRPSPSKLVAGYARQMQAFAFASRLTPPSKLTAAKNVRNGFGLSAIAENGAGYAGPLQAMDCAIRASPDSRSRNRPARAAKPRDTNIVRGAAAPPTPPVEFFEGLQSTDFVDALSVRNGKFRTLSLPLAAEK